MPRNSGGAPAAKTAAWPRVVLALAIGSVGGAIFDVLGLPLAWMLGAMTATAIASVAGVRLATQRHLRGGMIVVLGVMLGAAFTPDILGRLSAWPVSLAALVPYCAVTALFVGLYFRRVVGFDPPTAYFCAAPGGLSEMVIVGGAFGGDERRIALIHGMRVFLVVMAIPLALQAGGLDVAGGRGAGRVYLGEVDWGEMALLAGCGVVGVGLARLVRLQAGYILGPMLVSGAVHITGLSHAQLPWEVIAASQVVIGSALGTRFSGIAVAVIFRTLGQAIGATAIMLVISLGFAGVLTPALELPFAAVLLAFAPGGVAEMSLVALALDIDTAFVATHHLVRIAIVVALAPLAWRAFSGPPPTST